MAAEHGGPPDASLLLLFGVGSVLMRGAGCTVNDILDRELDKRVERTKDRPVASGQVSVENATVFLVAQLLLALGVLLQLNWFSIQVWGGVGVHANARLVRSNTGELCMDLCSWPLGCFQLTPSDAGILHRHQIKLKGSWLRVPVLVLTAVSLRA